MTQISNLKSDELTSVLLEGKIKVDNCITLPLIIITTHAYDCVVHYLYLTVFIL